MHGKIVLGSEDFPSKVENFDYLSWYFEGREHRDLLGFCNERELYLLRDVQLNEIFEGIEAGWSQSFEG
jgi:hypothetical protein